MTRRTTALAAGALLATVLALLVSGLATGYSSATYVSTSTTTSTVRAAADWSAPSVAMTSPGSSVKGTTALTATASDDRSGVASVTIQRQAVGADDWTTVCTDAVAPYSCGWNTTTVADGQYDLRAVAVDHAGFTATSDPVRTVVANNIVVVLTNPGELLRGSVALSTTIHGGGSLTWTVTVEYAATGTTQWRTACSSSSLLNNQFTCTWNTTALATGHYDLRAVARPTLGSAYTSAVIEDVVVDNTAPSAVMLDPGASLHGTVTLAATATEGESDSGVAQVEIQYAPGASGNYQNACTIAAPPYSCRFDTTKVASGKYSLRAVATDLVGNTTTTPAVADRVVDNTVSSVSVEDPGTYLTGTVTVNANASSSAGVASVRIQKAPSGTSTWTDLCSDAAAPYSCTWNTTTVTDGLYDVRAILTDGAGTQTTSAVVSGRHVDNAPLRGADVQTANGGGTPGRITDGDTVTYTYTRTVAPGTIWAGWTGSSTNVTARFRDGNVSGVGTGSKGDTLDIRVGTTTLALGSVNLKEDYLKSGKTVTFNGTLTATTVTVDGTERTVITLRIGTLASGKSTQLRTVSAASTVVWTPSGAARTPDGLACSTAAASETGATDREL